MTLGCETTSPLGVATILDMLKSAAVRHAGQALALRVVRQDCQPDVVDQLLAPHFSSLDNRSDVLLQKPKPRPRYAATNPLPKTTRLLLGSAWVYSSVGRAAGF